MASRSSRSNSGKLDRTLKELESAFTDWEALGNRKPRTLSPDEDAELRRKMKETEQSERKFREKTKKLLDQLRQQLAELND